MFVSDATRRTAIGGVCAGILWLACSAAGVASDASDATSRATESPAEESIEGASKAKARFTSETLRGQVVWLAEALERDYDVRTTRDAKERVLALQTDNGQLIPLIEDVRGRAFRRDERLRNRDVELFVRRYEGVPMAQIIRHYALKPDGKYIVDYWCDICAISMIEKGPCDCCQAPNVLRERKVE